MERISIVPELINSNGISITDINNMPVLICKRSKFKLNDSQFKKPHIVVDNFERGKYKEVEIVKIDMGKLEKLGFRIVSTKTNSKLRNYNNQKKSYMLEKKGKVLINAEIMVSMPANHILEMDVIGERIRMRGKNCYPYRRAENSTPWQDVKEDD